MIAAVLPFALIVSADPSLEVLRTGPGAGHHLSFDGRPVLLIGDSVTQGWAETGEDFDQAAYVRALASRKIRALHLWAFIAPQAGDDERIGYDAPSLLPWQRTGPARWDLLRPNDAYFARLRDLCRLAGEAGVFVVIQVFDGWTKTRFATHPFNRANGGPLDDRSQFVDLEDYDRELPESFDPAWSRRARNQYFQERFAARLIAATSGMGNVLYEMFNEGEWYDRAKRRRHEVHFLAFFEARARNLLISNDDHIAGEGFRAEPDCDIISNHRPNWSVEIHATESFDHYRSAFEVAPAKPFLFSEPVPEFAGAAGAEVDAMTRLMWGTALAGAGFFVQNDASFGFAPEARIASRAALRDAMLDREGACARFFNDLGVRWIAMRPDPGVASTGVALARRGSEYAVYIEGGGPFTVDLSGLAGAAFEGRFYDPRTGDLRPPIRIAGGRADETIRSPDARDWVLWLRRVETAPLGALFAIAPAPPLERRAIIAAVTLAIAAAVILFGFTALRKRRSHRHKASPDGTARGPAWLHQIGKWVFAHRVPLLLPWFLPLIVLFHPARMPGLPARLGIYAMILCGGAIRIWSTGYRTWSFDASGERHLMTAGPYSFVRHPIYIANLLLALSGFFAVGVWPLTVAFAVWYIATHLAVVVREDDALRIRYGDEWVRYAAEVRALVPRIRPYRDPRGEFRWEPILKGMEPFKVAIILAAVILWMEVFPSAFHDAASRFTALFASL
ncbi:MAG: hypothetical protein JXP34_28945 [Planctomycetes bacterium]|nr:hypothetical protein [Planctomycetota bacterium]